MSTREPETVTVPSNDRKTMELCANERLSRRCMLPKGHHGEHECRAVGIRAIWK
ncbi:MAG: hypothetical protein JWO36_2481 [Myxococcales bacterium]|nr:hypothetical protein [Myxococcales bacterium]